MAEFTDQFAANGGIAGLMEALAMNGQMQQRVCVVVGENRTDTCSDSNGAGKTTLFKMITGEETPDEGEFKVGETVELGYVDQNRDALDNSKNIWEAIRRAMFIPQPQKEPGPFGR